MQVKRPGDAQVDGARPVGRVARRAGQLPARWVVHTVGPVYRTDVDPDLLRGCYRRSVAVADKLLKRIEWWLWHTKLYGVEIVVTADTAAAANGLAFLELESVRVKGRQAAITL